MKNNRIDVIEQYLRSRRYCTMTALAEHFKVSLATVHRDVNTLVQGGYANKVHGGVVSLMPPLEEKSVFGGHFLQRMEMNREAKMIIAERAIQEIDNGDTVFVDSSTTAMFLARRLQDSHFPNLSIITNSVLVMEEFHRFPQRYALVSIGGTYNLTLDSFLGSLALQTLRQLRINKAFFSCAGVHENRMTTYHEDHSEFLKCVMKQSDRNYLLVDSSKQGKSGLYCFGNVSDVEKVLTDK